MSMKPSTFPSAAGRPQEGKGPGVQLTFICSEKALRPYCTRKPCIGLGSVKQDEDLRTGTCTRALGVGARISSEKYKHDYMGEVGSGRVV